MPLRFALAAITGGQGNITQTCIMLALVIGLIALERYGRRNRGYSGSNRRSRIAQPIPLPGWRPH